MYHRLIEYMLKFAHDIRHTESVKRQKTCVRKFNLHVKIIFLSLFLLKRGYLGNDIAALHKIRVYSSMAFRKQEN